LLPRTTLPAARPARAAMAAACDPMEQSAQMIMSLAEGARVRRNPATWAGGEEDGGDGALGTVAAVDLDAGCVTVLWDMTGQQIQYATYNPSTFALIIAGHEDRWLSVDDFPVGMRVFHDFRGAGAVIAIESKGDVKVVRCRFDAGDVHGYKESALSCGKLSPDPDGQHAAARMQAATTAATSAQPPAPQEQPQQQPGVMSFEEAAQRSSQMVAELRARGVDVPANAGTPAEATACAQLLLQQYTCSAVAKEVTAQATGEVEAEEERAASPVPGDVVPAATKEEKLAPADWQPTGDTVLKALGVPPPPPVLTPIPLLPSPLVYDAGYLAQLRFLAETSPIRGKGGVVPYVSPYSSPYRVRLGTIA